MNLTCAGGVWLKDCGLCQVKLTYACGVWLKDCVLCRGVAGATKSKLILKKKDKIKKSAYKITNFNALILKHLRCGIMLLGATN